MLRDWIKIWFGRSPISWCHSLVWDGSSYSGPHVDSAQLDCILKSGLYPVESRKNYDTTDDSNTVKVWEGDIVRICYVVEHAVRRSCLGIKLKRIPNVAERLGYTGHSLVTASFHAIPNQFRRSPWVEILVIKSQQHDMNVSRWWVQVKWHSESGHWWFQSWRCIATQRLLQPPHKVQPLHLFIIQYFSKGDRRWSVGECWHVFVLHTSSGFPYQFFHNKTRFSDMMPFKSWAGCEIYLQVEFKQDW